MPGAGFAQAGPRVGDVPPDWLGKTPKGEEVRVSERRGKVVVVAFWASWCGYCRAQFPVLVALQKAAGAERLEVVLVNYQEPTATYRNLVRELRKRDAGLTLTHDRNGAISEAYGVDGVPDLFMVGKSGRIGWTYGGYSAEAIPTIGAAVDRLLAEPWSPEPAAPAAPSPGLGAVGTAGLR